MNALRMAAVLAAVSLAALWAVNGLWADDDASGAGSAPVPAPVTPSAFSFELPQAGLTSAGVFDENGLLVRTLWRLTTRPAGGQSDQWDGLTDLGESAPAGKYEVRVVLNHSEYRNVAVIGNTGSPPGEPNTIPGNILDLHVDADGRIITANGWEEAGHDFAVFDADGKTLTHARFQIRNGNPGGAPYSIVSDETHLYVVMGGWASEPHNSKQQILRFTLKEGKRDPFTDESLAKSAGQIHVYERPEKLVPNDIDPRLAEALKRYPITVAPLQALAVRGDDLLCTDALGNKVLRFHKVTGKKLGEFDVTFPHALAVDGDGRVWVGHERSLVSVFSADGRRLATPIDDADFVRALRFGPKNQLVLTDSGASVVRLYTVDGLKATLASTFGGPAKPGDAQPDRFYQLRGAAMDAKGNLVTAQVTSDTYGARLAKFGPDGTCLWEHMGLEFCSTGAYGAHNPDEMISQRMHRYKLDRENNAWTYQGTMLASDPKYYAYPSGIPRILKIGGHEFFFQSCGDSMQVYRREGDTLRLCSMVGGLSPIPDGTRPDALPENQRKGMGLWSWSDVNRNGLVDKDEVNTFREFGEIHTRYAIYCTFGMNVDGQGNLYYCDHTTRGIHELPLAGLDEKGHPTYDWANARQLVAKDDGPAKFFPLMAVRTEDGSIYAMGRAEKGSVYPAATKPIDDLVWMGGELVAKYDKEGRRLWIIRMPEKTCGLGVIPGGGVMVGWYEKGVVYHVNADGLIIGSTQPGEAAGNMTGWLDTVGSVVANRDPKGVIDLFVEDSFLNRFLWYRVDDKNIQTVTVKVERN